LKRVDTQTVDPDDESVLGLWRGCRRVTAAGRNKESREDEKLVAL
jgi:hypothetical protein